MSKKACLGLIFGLSLLFVGTTASADHSWGPYHWSASSSPVNLIIGDNVSTIWDNHLRIAESDWDQSEVLDLSISAGLSNVKNCKPVSGRIEVCNSKYGNNGWLGIAQIWVNGNHIVQATTRVNDTYFARSYYNTPAWRQFVICQEIGHAFGLGHIDEDFYNPNLGSCMDYTNTPNDNQHPNSHDFEELASIYSHFDSFATILSPINNNGKNNVEESDWGEAVHQSQNGRTSRFEKGLGFGRKMFTFVIWAD
ncbi:MAG: hypothetical protein AAB392_01410 [Patescibacteria group bacterium]